MKGGVEMPEESQKAQEQQEKNDMRAKMNERRDHIIGLILADDIYKRERVLDWIKESKQEFGPEFLYGLFDDIMREIIEPESKGGSAANGRDEKRITAIQALVEIGKTKISSNSEGKEKLIEKRKEIINTLREMLERKDIHKGEKEVLIQGLGQILKENIPSYLSDECSINKAANVLIQTLCDENSNIVREAVKALGEIASGNQELRKELPTLNAASETTKKLLDIISNQGDKWLRRSAIEALGYLCDDTNAGVVIPHLIDIANNDGRWEKIFVTEALGRIGERYCVKRLEILQKLAELLCDNNMHVQICSAIALRRVAKGGCGRLKVNGKIQEKIKKADELLFEQLANEDEKKLPLSELILWRARETKDIPLLVEALVNESTRPEATQILCDFNDVASIVEIMVSPEIANSSKQELEEVIAELAKVLVQIPKEEGLEQFQSIMEKQSIETKLKVIDALGETQDRRAIPYLNSFRNFRPQPGSPQPDKEVLRKILFEVFPDIGLPTLTATDVIGAYSVWCMKRFKFVHYFSPESEEKTLHEWIGHLDPDESLELDNGQFAAYMKNLNGIWSSIKNAFQDEGIDDSKLRLFNHLAIIEEIFTKLISKELSREEKQNHIRRLPRYGSEDQYGSVEKEIERYRMLFSCDIRDVVEKAINKFAKNQPNVAFCKPHGEFPKVCANEQDLVQVFWNLIDNAYKALDEVPKVHRKIEVSIEVERDEISLGLYSYKKIIVRIMDTGCGMPESKRKIIFSPIIARRGLTNAIEVIKDYHGSIQVESKPMNTKTGDWPEGAVEYKGNKWSTVFKVEFGTAK
jgi:HEAT repeat protein